MAWLESPVIPSLLYVLLVAAVWLSVLAVVTPGTGVLELLALAAWVVSGMGALQLPLNPWALLVVLLGGGLFLWSLRRRSASGWLLLGGVVMAIGSAFLFDGANRVHPLVAIAASAATLAFFWFVVRKTVEAHSMRPSIDPSQLFGKIGEARTTLDPTGSIQVGSELWTARAETPVGAGAKVKVTGREGLVLTVSPVPTDTK